MQPIAVTGFNLDLVVENTASGPPYHARAVEFNPGENLAFYQAGLPGKNYGLPVNGRWTSALDNETEFAFAPYEKPNALVLSSATGLTEGTLTLMQPAVYRRIAVLAHSAGGGGSPSLTLHFADGRNVNAIYQAPDWFNNSGYALQGVERINLTTGSTQGAPTNPRFYQTTLDLEALLGGTPAPLMAITFQKAAGAGSTGIYAVSGEPWPDQPARILQSPASLTVVEPGPARFEALVTGQPFPALQWFRNGQPVAGATNTWFTLEPTSPADDGSTVFLRAFNVVTGQVHSVTSSVAVLHVVPDTNPPVLLTVWASGRSQVVATFSEPVEPSGALDPTHYAVLGTHGPVEVASVELSGSGDQVRLSTATPLSVGESCTLILSGITDRAAAANPLPPDTVARFSVTGFEVKELGGAGLLRMVEAASNGLQITTRGRGWDEAGDEGGFLCQPVTGDFDLRVRVNSLGFVNVATGAGLMLREDSAPGARSAGVMATPTLHGCYFLVRNAPGAQVTRSGHFPANPGATWLRLRRTGNQIEGFAGPDGLHWMSLGTASMDLPETVQVGLAVASASTSQWTRVDFTAFSDTPTPAGPVDLPFEPLGPCTRLTSLVISEIMYHPTNPALEFIELFNARAEPEDISGYRLDGSVQFTFPPGTVLPGGGFVVVALSPDALRNTYGLTNALGPWSGRLPNDRGQVRLRHRTGAVFLNIEYRDDPPWPVAANGAGPSLVLAHPSLGENDPAAWSASQWPGGSPGLPEGFLTDPLRALRINEFLAHTDPPQLDFVELINTGTESVDLGGCTLSDEPDTDRYVIPTGTILPPGGLIAFTELNLGFALNAAGETIYLRAPDRRVLDAVRFGGQANGTSTGRWPDGREAFHPLQQPTPGAPNTQPRLGEVILNEIHYHPVSEDDDDQFIELHNRTDHPVALAGWRLDDGVQFTFPESAVIPPRGYLVVARNAGRLMQRYPWLNATNLLGNFSGRLAHGGERIALTRPDRVVQTNALGQVNTNLIHIVVDEVTWRDGGRWPSWADGGGSSLERVHPDTHGRHPAHWADSDETTKAPWTLISTTGTIDLGSTTADQLQVLLMGPGECLLDNVEVLTPAGVNLIANSTFENGTNGWTAEGTMAASGWEPSEGYQSARSYHIRAVDRGDNQINRVRTPLTSTLAPGTTNVTIRAAVRWLKGHPQILLRLRGNWLECAGDMWPTPQPGTPGLPNSRLQPAPPIAIGPVRHSPVLPAANEPIRITAHVEDLHGVPEVRLQYRIDPDTTLRTLVMHDDGQDGDLRAGDGLFTATLPGQPTSTLVAFWIEANRRGTPVTAKFPADAPARECLIRVGETQPAGTLPVYRVWMTRTTLNTWTSRPKLDNTPLDVTFVVGNHRVIYNAGALNAGSPYIAPGFSSPISGRCGYTIELPRDDRFLGDTDLVLDWPGGHGGETTAIQEQMAWWIADRLNLPYSHRYHIRLHVNGVTDEHRQAIFEAVHQPGRRFVEAWSPDQPDGQFFKIDRAFEFSDSGSLIADPMPRLQNYTTTGGAKKRERYRWTWMYRATPRVHDYTNLFALVDALNAPAPEPYTSATTGLVDLEEWMRMFAFEHIIVNFDSWGHEIGKNMYTFLPRGGRWVLYAFDLDWLMLVSPRLSSRFAPDQAALFTSEDPTVARMYAHPPFQRAYWRAVRDALSGPLDPAQAFPVMDAKYQVLRANNVRWCDGQALTDPSALKTWFNVRRTFLQSQLAAVTAPFELAPTVLITNGMGVLQGTAPVEAVTLAVNGQPWQVLWTTVTNWTATVPLHPGTNVWTVTALDRSNNPLPGLSRTLTFVSPTPDPRPEGYVVFNEILYRPRLPGASFVELFNRSPNQAFDLSGWRINGLDYTFPGGTFIAPQGYLVLAADRSAFMTVFGPGVFLFDVFPGNLQDQGETLSLLRPGNNPDEWIVVDRVRYESVPPWPQPQPGQSLQLLDPETDNSRLSSWSVVQTPPPGPASILILDYDHPWRYQQTTNLDGIAWTAPDHPDANWPVGPGLLAYENNSAIVPLVRTPLNDPRQPPAGLPAGHAYYFRTSFVVTGSLAGYTLTARAYVDDGAVFHLNGQEFHRLRMPSTNPILHNTYATAQPPGGDATSPDAFPVPMNLLRPGTNVLAVQVHQQNANSSDIVFGLQLVAERNPAAAAEATPGAPNADTTNLPPYPTIWINELQPENLSGPADASGQREPWLEIHNPGTNAVALRDCFLSDQLQNLTLWAFPEQAVLPPGGFILIWCDGQPEQTTATEWHTPFRLAPGAGTVFLAQRVNNTVRILDYLAYTNLPANRTWGDWPDGQPFHRRPFHIPTPAAPNNPAAPRVQVFINEWLADNARTLADPADGGFEDWFELYNAGDEPADLGGYYLTDNLNRPDQFRIPDTGQYIVPPRGFLLVWADNEPEQNRPDRPELHVNFALSRSGEAIGLYAPDLTPVDTVTFGPQATDVAQGRFPDGAASIRTLATPTPAAPNQAPNSPPRIQPVPNLTLYLGQTLQWTITATDDDIPAQSLTFTLGPTAPAGATIHPQTGRLFWSPDHAPAQVQFEVLVTDNGQPPLSASIQFLVTVRPRPALELRPAQPGWELHWTEGTLQEADTVTGPWRDIPTPPPYRMPLNETQKFYRIRVTP
ncbi:hypothetical protein G4L39_05030 [Limisphaera ngatamarikiensis]|uniref:LTD domain-containing protein n=1 Tax=Limisphaera ngatamarikiensis TaxID=1324935 RepID=A0A6M1RFD5_9BACT|nr:lamin tail domain-containing protein [Limisphaera ngatamarikiensis]NGO38758.1 hypothetical protein [Limisphaera ngatamarikiensis]